MDVRHRLLAIALIALTEPAVAGVADFQASDVNQRPAEICATTVNQLELTARLRQLVPFFPADTVSTFVNQTRGSYFEVDTRSNQLKMMFLTSGLLDVYLIRRDGVVQFCDDGTHLSVKGLDRTEELTIAGSTLILGKGGPKQRFGAGEMPVLLKKLIGRQ